MTNGNPQDEYDEEAEELIAGARRQLKFKLQSAGLLRPNRERSPESDALEAQLRREAQEKLDASLQELNAARRQEPSKADKFGPSTSSLDRLSLIGMTSTWLDELREDAASAHATGQLRSDWQEVESWLGIRGRINAEQYRTFYFGFSRYVRAHGAPSKNLRQSFAHFETVLPESSTTLPEAIVGVYARLLASDSEIEAERTRKELEPIFDDLARARHPSRPVFLGPGFITAMAGLTSFWLGVRAEPISLIAVPILAFAIYLIVFGPRPEEVQGSPSKTLMSVFAAVLATGVCAIGYLIGIALS